jgi:ABC-type amino acid transport substrate-binding protein
MNVDATNQRPLGPAPGRMLACLIPLVLLAGIGWPANLATAADPVVGDQPQLLRVGVTPDYPALVFREGDGFKGLEIDLARALGQALGRPIQFVVVTREEQIDSLLQGRTDIIMSGMSVTKARQLRVAFTKPYLQNQLRAIFTHKNALRFKSAEDVLRTKGKIGVVTGTTSDVFAKQNCTNADVMDVASRRDVAYFLTSGRMELFIDDTFALADVFSRNEAEITYLPQALSQEDLAWAVRPGETEFLNKVNGTLDRWKTDGSLERALDRWIPYLKKLRSAPSTP